MKNIVFGIAGFLVMLVAFSTVVRADGNIKEGKWEITTVIDKDNEVKGPVNNPSVLSQQGQNISMVENGVTPVSPNQGKIFDECITNDNPIPDVQEMVKQYPGCGQIQPHQNDGAVDYELNCVVSPNVVNMKGNLVFSGENMVGLRSSNVVSGDKVSAIEEHLKGKYIGPC